MPARLLHALASVCMCMQRTSVQSVHATCCRLSQRAIGAKLTTLRLAQVKLLEELWEEHGAAPDAVQRVRDGLDGGAFSRTSVARQLKAMGLKRGALTTRQVCSPRTNTAFAI